MAVILVTGVPGAGKTSLTLQALLDEQLKELQEAGRPIYTSIDLTPEALERYGIQHLFDVLGPALDYNPANPDRKRFDVSKIHELPTGAYIVIDEAQFVFPTRGPGSKTPPHVAAFETHRHRGHDERSDREERDEPGEGQGGTRADAHRVSP